jgi:hypothetical protein
MSDDITEDATVVIDGTAVDLDVASDPDDARSIVTGMTITASETVSTGDYESYEPFQSVQLTFSPAIDVSEPAGRVEVRRRALSAHADVQADLQRAVDNRLSATDFEDWPEGVDAPDLETDNDD